MAGLQGVLSMSLGFDVGGGRGGGFADNYFVVNKGMVLWFIQGDSKNLSPLACKSNNLGTMHCTTLKDTPFERADNFLSNAYIYTRFSIRIASSQPEKQTSAEFWVFRFQRTRTICFLAVEAVFFAFNNTCQIT